MSDLSNRLRDRASELSDVGIFATAHEMRQAADLIDQQAAEIERLNLELKMAFAAIEGHVAQKDEWRRRAELLWREGIDEFWQKSFSQEAAQWFED